MDLDKPEYMVYVAHHMELKPVLLTNPSLTLPQFRCLRCRHRWVPRKPERPRRCAGCGDVNWDRPRNARRREKTA